MMSDNSTNGMTCPEQVNDCSFNQSDQENTVSRPWGNYTVLEEGETYKVKRLIVNPLQSLSLQLHYHRSENWIIVNGMAKITKGDQALYLSTNDSTFIPAGTRHRLENPGKVDLVVIEVQSGSYLGEDDIVRFSDIYGRS